MYIDDVVSAIVLGIEGAESTKGVYNVGSNEQLSVMDIATTLKEKYKSNISLEITGNYRLGDIRDNIADLTKIQTKLGYSPTVNFKQGISNFVDWVNEQEIESTDSYARSLDEMKEKGLYK